MAQELLLEIGTEEIPAGYIGPALDGLGRHAHERLRALRLGHGPLHTWGTPRRLAVVVEGVADIQHEVEQHVMGPPERVGFDPQGNATAAARGFAQNQGVAVDALEIVETPKGRYLSARKRLMGRPAGDVLREELPQWITALSFPKSMRWGESSLRFARPIHWIVALLGGEVVPFRIEGMEAGRTTRGHRFMSPGQRSIQHPSEYREICRSAHVIVDPLERVEIIRKESEAAAARLGGRLVGDPELLNTVAQLVEYPVVVTGRFDEAFLQLPREVLITAMREHQKFFSVEDAAGGLLSFFVNIANLRNDSMDLIRRGNERVLRARLADARFFFMEDRKRTLADRVQDLGGVIFHAKLGSLLEKVRRVQDLARVLAQELAPDEVERVVEAAHICKADLTTDMVGEFPTLQGIMGREYALLEGKDVELAEAIREHYRPAFSGDSMPRGTLGMLLALADKADTIAGCFAVGDVPTGAGDPLGLRRAALGILNILLERDCEFPLSRLVEESLRSMHARLHQPPDRVQADILDFFRVRLENLWTGQGHGTAAVDAVLAAGMDNIPDAHRRLDALEAFMGDADFDALAVSFKRVLNIAGREPGGPVDPALFEQGEEAELMARTQGAENAVGRFLLERAPLSALQALAGLKGPIDAFFDAVLVNAENEALRRNRLNLLCRLGQIFLKLADFSRIGARA